MRGWHRLVPLSLALGLAACSGGSSSAPPTTDSLSGQIAIPTLSVPGGAYIERRINEDAFHAEGAGFVTPTQPVEIRGAVGGDRDPRDVFRVAVAAPLQVSVELVADGPVDVHVFEVGLGREVVRLGSREQRTIDVRANEMDLVVSSQRPGMDYRLAIRATGSGRRAPHSLPLPAAVEGPSSDIQARYLGAQHPMVPGEIVVMRRAPGPMAAREVAPAPLEMEGLQKVRGEHGPTEVYRLTGKSVPAAAIAGASLEQSLELRTARMAKRIAALPEVHAASPNYLYEGFADPNDTHYNLQWHYQQIKMPAAWDITKGSTSVIVGVLDSGVVLGHPDFAGRLVAGYDMISDAARALDGDGRDNNPDDPGSGGGLVPSVFHGTHVAGTIGASTNNSAGVAGVDWNCKLMPLRALGKGGSGTLDDIANGILFGAKLSNAAGVVPATACNVINMSLGGPGSSSVMQSACDAAVAAGVILIAAAGNDNASTQNFPASYASVISVGATDFLRQRAPYSNFATTIDIWAPGGDASVDRNGDNNPDGVLSVMATGFNTSRGATYSYLQGTSMACPHVAGVASLVLAVRPGTTPAEMRTFLVNNTQAGVNLPNSGKLVDCLAVLQAANGASATPILTATPDAVSLDANTSAATVTMANKGSGTLTFTSASITYTNAGDSWLSQSVTGSGSGIVGNALALTVDRTGLANGDRNATVNLSYTDGSNTHNASVKVTIQVGQKTAGSETVFVLLVDFTTLETKFQTSTTAANNYDFTITNVAAGTYLLAAGTDRDNDDVIGDADELFGIYPSTTLPDSVVVAGSGQTVSSLNFPIEKIVGTLRAGGEKRLELKRLR